MELRSLLSTLMNYLRNGQALVVHIVDGLAFLQHVLDRCVLLRPSRQLLLVAAVRAALGWRWGQSRLCNAATCKVVLNLWSVAVLLR